MLAAIKLFHILKCQDSKPVILRLVLFCLYMDQRLNVLRYVLKIIRSKKVIAEHVLIIADLICYTAKKNFQYKSEDDIGKGNKNSGDSFKTLIRVII